jgi:hypothetical protein
MKRFFAGLFGIISLSAGIYGFYTTITGKGGIDLNQKHWSINFIPGEFLVLMLWSVMAIGGIYAIIYAISPSRFEKLIRNRR